MKPKKQLTLKETAQRKEKKQSPPTQKDIERMVAKMLISTCLPHKKCSAFHELVKILNNDPLTNNSVKFIEREPEFYRNLIMKDLYQQLIIKINQSLEELGHVSLTADYWMEMRDNQECHIYLLILTAHGITKDFKRFSVTLKCDISSELTPQLIAFKLDSILQECNIKRDAVHVLVHNQDQSVVKGTDLCEIENMTCIVYKLQHCVKTNIKKEQELHQLIGKVKKLVDSIKYFEKENRAFKNVQIEKLQCKCPRSLKPEFPVRWNSTFYMLEKFLKLKDSLNIYLTTNEKFTITPEEWLNVEKTLALLKIFEEFTKSMCSSEALISAVIPSVNSLIVVLGKQKFNNTTILKSVIERIRSEIVNICIGLYKKKSYTISTYLDPRFKTTFFNTAQKKKVEDEIIVLINQELNKAEAQKEVHLVNKGDNIRVPPPSKTDEPKPSTSSSYQCYKSELEYELKRLLLIDNNREDIDPSNENGTAKAMLQAYIKESKISPDEDPLAWWDQNGYKFKGLQTIVRRFLSTPPICVASQKPRQNAQLQKARLYTEKTAKRIFLLYNLDLIP